MPYSLSSIQFPWSLAESLPFFLSDQSAGDQSGIGLLLSQGGTKTNWNGRKGGQEVQLKSIDST